MPALLCLWAVSALAADADGPVIGEVGRHYVEPGQTLMDVARLYDLGYVELAAANPGLNPWQMPVGMPLVLPTAHILPRAPQHGLVVNLGDMRLYWFDPDGNVYSMPMGIGREGRSLPLGTLRVLGKRVNPRWVVPPSIRAEKPDLPAEIPPGPDNPLGNYALDLRDEYRIHGTNLPDGVGRRTSHGCVRLYPEDVAALFPDVPVGTPVLVIDQPAELAWVDDRLLLQIHPSPHQADQLEDTNQMSPEPAPGLDDLVRQAAGDRLALVDWAAVRRAEQDRNGLPVVITRPPLLPPANVDESP